MSRWGSNPGSITLAGQRLKIQVPRVRNKRDRKEVKLESYQALSGRDTFDETVFKQMIHGVSTRDYKKAVDLMPEAFGVSKSAVSEGFKRESVKKLKELLERDLKEDDIVAFLVDGKYLEDTQILVVLGVLSDGTKKVLGFSETNTENTVACKELLKDLVRRGMSTDVPRLAVVDGAKGLSAAIKEVFGNNAIIQRCQWHKRENVISHLPEQDKRYFKTKLQQAYEEPLLEDALKKLEEIKEELTPINESAVRSLEEGLSETLTLHRLDVPADLRPSLKTTNCIENVNRLFSNKIHRVNKFRNSSQRQRWTAAALLDAESRMYKIRGADKMLELKQILNYFVEQQNKIKMKKVA